MDKKKKIELKVLNVSISSTNTGAYIMEMEEVDGPRKLLVTIGSIEAQSMLLNLKKIIPPRPLTHNLFASCLEILGVELMRVLIYKEELGIYYSYIYLKADETIIRMDARTSDAVTMAIRMGAPILVYEELFEEEERNNAEREKEDEDEETAPYTDEFLYQDTMDILQKALDEAIANENYERAVYLRDEIAKRKQQQ